MTAPQPAGYPHRVSQSDDPSDAFLAACVQFDVRTGDVDANIDAALAGIDAAAAEGARLCVLPEMWSTSFRTDWDTALVAAAARGEDALRNRSAMHDLVVVGSAIEVDGDRHYNTARVHDRGVTVGSYRKIHLFSPNAEHRHMDAGDLPLVVDTSVGRLAVAICYDLRFPDLCRYYFHKGAEALVVPCQWPEARAQHWRTLARARAIENEMFVIGCNRTGQEPSLKTDEMMAFPGDSRIVDPTGEVLVAGSGAEGPLLAEVEPRKVRTMRRILPIARDQRPHVYRRLWDDAWPEMLAASREGDRA